MASTTAADNTADKPKLNTYHFVVQVVESQRRYVLTGWTGRARFPLDPYEWSDTHGQCSRPTREVDYELPRCPPYPCEWVGDWEIYLGTDEKDWYTGGGRKPAVKSSTAPNSRNGSNNNFTATAAATEGSSDAPTPTNAEEGSTLKYTRFDDDGWEYAFDYPRSFRAQQSATMSWVRRRFWRRTFVVRAPSIEDVEDEVPFPDRFSICMLDHAIDYEAHLAAVNDYMGLRPAPRVSDYKVGLRRIGLKLYNPTDRDGAPRSRSQSAEKQRQKE